MKTFSFFLFTSLFCASILSQQHLQADDNEDQEPIVVRIATESSLTPIYVPPLTNEGGELADVYVKQLEQILLFDLNHNGSSSTVKQKTELNQMARSGAFENVGRSADWRAQNIYYVVKGRVQGRQLSVIMLNVSNQSLKTADAIQLSGDLSQDRRQIHRLADMIHKTLFGTDGIASTRILYTVKTPFVNPNQKVVSEVWEADYDGANARQLTREGTLCVTPAYIPPKPGYLTGGYMYASYQLGQPKIYIGNLKDNKTQRLSYMRGNQLMPAISPQRDKVAFVCDVTGNPDLFLQPCDLCRFWLVQVNQIQLT